MSLELITVSKTESKILSVKMWFGFIPISPKAFSYEHIPLSYRLRNVRDVKSIREVQNCVSRVVEGSVSRVSLLLSKFPVAKRRIYFCLLNNREKSTDKGLWCEQSWEHEVKFPLISIFLYSPHFNTLFIRNVTCNHT